LSTLLKYGFSKDYFHLLSDLFVLLERTQREEVSDFILAIVTTTNWTDERISKCVQLIKEFSKEIVCKPVCLEMSVVILNELAKRFERDLNECLDDLVSTATRSIESGIDGFTFFLSVLRLLKDRKSDNGGRLLELYESQFSIAVKFGFIGFDFESAPLFLFEYLQFHEKNLRERPEQYLTVVQFYVSGMLTCSEKDCDGYLAIAAFMSDVARSNALLNERFKEPLPIFAEILTKAVDTAMVTLRKGDSVEISLLRIARERFYSYLLSGFVWLHSRFGESSKIPDIMNFLVEELQNSHDKWRTAPALEALSLCFNYFPRIPVDSIEAVLKLSSGVLTSRFLLSVAQRKNEASISQRLFDICLSSCFDYRILANLITPDLEEDAAVRVVDHIFEADDFRDESLATLTILMKSSWKRQLTWIFKTTKVDLQYKLRIIRRIAKVSDYGEEGGKVRQFLNGAFKRGGMLVLARILSDKADMVALVDFEKVCQLCEKDLKNSVVFLQFLSYIFCICDVDESVGSLLMKCAVRCGLMENMDELEAAMKLAMVVEKKFQGTLRAVFDELSQRERQVLMQYVGKFVVKADIRRNALNLRQFSSEFSRRRSSSDDEWQDL
jgi:hypothetical protein